MSDAICADCGADTMPKPPALSEWYMVRDRVWEEAGMPTGGLSAAEYEEICRNAGVPPHDVGTGLGMLCIGCLESRLGRRLRPEDFTGAPVNDLRYPGHSARLRDRLLG